ncbi:MAG TPA: histidine kinase dimerization/phospho-acceptor domain-containing protein, partial [Gemmatimonas sp.]|nr:histidine kinase dimerization/phospho-acceptor domain-containing protein [Gemmatimonas sp.]
MRLRTRYFLISWPLVVVALAAVAFGVDRWTVVELDRIEQGQRPARNFTRDSALAAWVAAEWQRRDAPPPSAELLQRAGSDSAGAVVIVSSAGALVVTTDAAIALVSPPAVPGKIARFARRGLSTGTIGDAVRTEAVFALDGLELRAGSDRVLGGLYVLPVPRGDLAADATGNRRAALRRRIWSVALAASLFAAAAALLLAGPLVSRLQRVANAAGSVRRGALGTRVQDSGNDEIADLAESFNGMAASLAAAQENQRKLTSDVAHELRTPLTNMLGLVEAMQDGLKPRDDLTLAILHREIGLLTSLVRELQELSLAESGALRFDIADIDAAAVAIDAIAAVSATAGVHVALSTNVHAPVHARADARRLHQCIVNLLQNAITHTPSHGRITVDVIRSTDHATIVVEDTGSGIPP